MNKFFKDILTGVDNITFDIGRAGLAGGLLVFFGMEIVKVIMQHTFSEIDFGAGLAGILAGGSGGLALKHKTEPPGPNNA